jgi:hypothetical protein
MSKMLSAIVVLLTASVTLHGQGFGANKCDIKVQRLVPPPTKISGPIQIVVDPGSARDAALSSQMQSQLEASIMRLDPALTISAASPQTQLAAEISEYTENRQWESRNEKELKKTGTEQVWNDKKRAYETKDVWNQVDVTKKYLTIKGLLSVTWKAIAATKQIVASDVGRATFQSSYLDGQEAPDPAFVKGSMVGSVVPGIVQRLVPYPEVVEVYVAKGKLEPGCKLAEGAQWTRALESWETFPAFKNPKDEAYRVFNIGVAHEALAYSAGASRDFESSLRYLDKAAENYGLAVELNAGEKYFKDPQGRIQTSLKYYTTLRDQSSGDKSAASSSGKDGTSSVSSEKPPADGLTNDGIIEYVRSGFTEDFVLDQIRTTPKPRFSVAPTDLVKLKQAGVSEQIITEMIRRK